MHNGVLVVGLTLGIRIDNEPNLFLLGHFKRHLHVQHLRSEDLYLKLA
ncbi:MAG TPA: hypothetical protein VL921_17685 [Candidatus Udaeobacter sp.]|nr:hypothetical protein [Candidatus Udaeobacter sp.]